MATIWPYLPNIRREPYVLTREYRTDIITSRNGKEQRRALRQTPRKRVEYLTGVAGDCLREFDRSMVSAQRQLLAIPDRVRFVILPDGLEGDATTVTLSPVPAWIADGVELLLVSGSRVAARTVESVDSGGTVTFTESEAASWPAGTRLYPSLHGYLDSSIKAPVISPRGVVDIAVAFEVDVGSELAEDAGAAPVTFADREVFLKRPNRWAPIDLERLQEGAADVDYGFGRIRRFFPIAFATRVWGAEYTGCDFDHAELIRQFFDRMKGRQGEFYMPTWQADFKPVAGVTAAGTTLTVEGALSSFTGDTVFKAIALRKKSDGSWLLRTVNSIAPSGGSNSVLTVSAAWGETIALAGIDMVSWLPVWRFATDILAMSWPREDVAEMTLSFQMLENLPAET
jgi:hypothetical protein